MNWHFDEGRERIPDEEDIYGINDQNEFDSDVWMPFEAAERRKKRRIRIFAIVVATAFALVFAAVGLRTLLGW